MIWPSLFKGTLVLSIHLVFCLALNPKVTVFIFCYPCSYSFIRPIRRRQYQSPVYFRVLPVTLSISASVASLFSQIHTQSVFFTALFLFINFILFFHCSFIILYCLLNFLYAVLFCEIFEFIKNNVDFLRFLWYNYFISSYRNFIFRIWSYTFECYYSNWLSIFLLLFISISSWNYMWMRNNGGTLRIILFNNALNLNFHIYALGSMPFGSYGSKFVVQIMIIYFCITSYVEIHISLQDIFMSSMFIIKIMLKICVEYSL